MRYIFLSILVSFLGLNTSNAQIGGTRTYPFLNLDYNARIIAAGGSLITIKDKDVALGYANPSLLNPKMNQFLSLSYNNYLSGINHGFAGYVKHFDSLGTFSIATQFIHYGKFEGRDEDNIYTRDFSAQDYNFQIGYGNQYNKYLRYGVNFKFIYSALERYVSTAGAFDFAGLYNNNAKRINATLLVKNLGVQFIPYRKKNREPLPLDIQIGFSKKLKYNPLRYSIIIHDLQTFDLRYINKNYRNKEIDIETQEVKIKEITMADNIMRHFNFVGELILTDNFILTLGYNHQRRKELSPEVRKMVTGFSWGIGLGVKKYVFNFGMCSMFPGQPSFNFSLLKNVKDFKKIKKK